MPDNTAAYIEWEYVEIAVQDLFGKLEVMQTRNASLKSFDEDTKENKWV